MQFRDGEFVIKGLGDLHHAYLIEGGAATRDALVEALQSAGIATVGNPDFLSRTHETLGIDDAHDLSRAQLKRGVDGESKIFVILTRQITRPAQNALLKVFEEPTAGTHFFVLIPRPQSLLPTLRSRSHEITTTAAPSSDARKFVRTFVTATLPKRLTVAGEIAGRDDHRQLAYDFVSALEQQIAEAPSGASRQAEFAEAVVRAHEYLEESGANVKVVLENLALQFSSDLGSKID